MDKRRTELIEISSYIRNIDNEVTLILQSLQWDRNNLLEGPPLVSCKYDSNHRVPPNKLELHEERCRLRSLGYSTDELLLPEPVDVNANTLVTLSKKDIAHIIDYAAKVDPLFQKGRGAQDSEPLSLERLQLAYNRDERRAIHDAVVSAVPSCHDLTDLALPSSGEGAPAARARSRAELLAELRDMKRRRTKYRVAAKTRNYSDVLRDVIATQMEHFSAVHTETNPKVNLSKDYEQSKDNANKTKEATKLKRYDEVQVKKEPVEDKSYSKDYESRQRKRDRSKERYKGREREKRHDDYYKRGKHRDEKDRYSSSSKDRSRDRNEYRSSDKYRRGDSRHFRRDHKEHPTNTPSRNSDVRYKRERQYDSYSKSHREEEHRRYYDYKEDEFEATKKRIKQEKD